MAKRLGNFLIFCGLICLVIFFTSNAFVFDDAVYFFGGVSFLSLGLIFKRGARQRELEKKKGRWWRKKKNREEIYD